MKRHIARHFPAKDIKIETSTGAEPGEIVIPNDYRHLELEQAESVAEKFRAHLVAEGYHDFRLRGYTKAFRTRYSLLLSTVGITKHSPAVLVPELSVGSDADSKLMIEAFKAHGIRVWEYLPEQLDACDRIGERGATAIKQVEAAHGITEGETIYFTHAPICSFFAIHLAGNAEAREQILKVATNEADRFIVEDGKVTFVPLG